MSDQPKMDPERAVAFYLDSATAGVSPSVALGDLALLVEVFRQASYVAGMLSARHQPDEPQFQEATYLSGLIEDAKVSLLNKNLTERLELNDVQEAVASLQEEFAK